MTIYYVPEIYALKNAIKQAGDHDEIILTKDITETKGGFELRRKIHIHPESGKNVQILFKPSQREKKKFLFKYATKFPKIYNLTFIADMPEGFCVIFVKKFKKRTRIYFDDCRIYIKGQTGTIILKGANK